MVALLTLVEFVVEVVVTYRPTAQITKGPGTVELHNHSIEDLKDMTRRLPYRKQTASDSHIMSQGSTVTVVLLTFEALVVALVPVVVATYQARHLGNKESGMVSNGISVVQV